MLIFHYQIFLQKSNYILKIFGNLSEVKDYNTQIKQIIPMKCRKDTVNDQAITKTMSLTDSRQVHILKKETAIYNIYKRP